MRSARIASTSSAFNGGCLLPHKGQQQLVQPKSCLQARRSVTKVNATVAPEVEMSDEKKDIQRMLNKPYKYGFKTIIESDVFPKGLSEDVVRAISAKKEEPEWLLEFR